MAEFNEFLLVFFGKLKTPQFPYEILWPLGLKSFPVLGSFDVFPFDEFSSTISGADILLSPIKG